MSIWAGSVATRINPDTLEQLFARVKAHFLVDVLDVGLHRAFRHIELFFDRCGLLAQAKEEQNLLFPRGEVVLFGELSTFHADAVLCGPAMHYPNFGEMAARLACKFNAAGIPAIAAMAEENPAVSHYYQQVPIVKMPKKGGIGLNNSFKQMAQLVVAKANGKETKQLEETSCF